MGNLPSRSVGAVGRIVRRRLSGPGRAPMVCSRRRRRTSRGLRSAILHRSRGGSERGASRPHAWRQCKDPPERAPDLHPGANRRLEGRGGRARQGRTKSALTTAVIRRERVGGGHSPPYGWARQTASAPVYGRGSSRRGPPPRTWKVTTRSAECHWVTWAMHGSGGFWVAHLGPFPSLFGPSNGPRLSAVDGALLVRQRFLAIRARAGALRAAE